MPLYRCSLRMAHDASFLSRRKWSNTFYINTASAAAAAAAIAGGWISFLKGAARNTVFAYSVFASDLLPGTTDFSEVSIPTADQRGTMNPGGVSPGEKYLLKAAVGVRIPVPASRPSRKFWRPGLSEGDVSDGVNIVAPTAALIASVYNAFIAGSSGALVDPDGEPWQTGVAVYLTTREFGRESALDVPAAPPPPA